jgi:hypothetical protein
MTISSGMNKIRKVWLCSLPSTIEKIRFDMNFSCSALATDAL